MFLKQADAAAAEACWDLRPWDSSSSSTISSYSDTYHFLNGNQKQRQNQGELNWNVSITICQKKRTLLSKIDFFTPCSLTHFFSQFDTLKYLGSSDGTPSRVRWSQGLNGSTVIVDLFYFHHCRPEPEPQATTTSTRRPGPATWRRCATSSVRIRGACTRKIGMAAASKFPELLQGVGSVPEEIQHSEVWC